MTNRGLLIVVAIAILCMAYALFTVPTKSVVPREKTLEELIPATPVEHP